MPWFYCNDCGDSIKKPKILAHTYRCSASSFTCIDCSATFDQYTVQSHTRCVTEKEKYVDGATKPGGFAAQGYVSTTATSVGGGEDVVGTEYLSTCPPWICSLCNVRCTSRETLMHHASGTKHRRKVRSATNGIHDVKEAIAMTPPTDPAEQRPSMSEEASAVGQEPEKAKKQKKPRREDKRKKRQIRLGIEILAEKKDGMTLKRFEKKLRKRSPSHSDLADLIDAIKCIPDVVITEKRIALKS